MKSVIIILILSIIFTGCFESTSPQIDSNITFKQFPGCNKRLPKNNSDSCFIYTFEGTLNVNLCLPANCCPDSNRFEQYYTLNNDTIFLLAIDTAARLCRCSCNYLLEFQIDNLERDSYTFICTYYDSIFYSETLKR